MPFSSQSFHDDQAPPGRGVFEKGINRGLYFVLLLGITAMACARSTSPEEPWQIVAPWTGEGERPTASPTVLPTATAASLSLQLPPTRDPDLPYSTPTPDPIRPAPPTRVAPEQYIVGLGDTLAGIAGQVGVGVNQIMVANGLADPNFLAVGQVLQIPTAIPQEPGPSFKLMPDSELVYGPTAAQFDIHSEVLRWDGTLARYIEVVEEQSRTGADIVYLVARRFSVNPRLLLALLEYQSGWLTRHDTPADPDSYPMGYIQPGYEGLYAQLAWTADQLNLGYYLWFAGWSGPYLLADGSVIVPGPGINAATAAVQYVFSNLYSAPNWRQVVAEEGFYQVYRILFGVPFDQAFAAPLPPDLSQPPMQLPFEAGRSWSFTGGPHGGWGNGSAWAAIDFAPPGDALGCVRSNEWVVAVADGLVLISENGEVLQDLDGDGFEQTGWTVLYMHVETRDRVPAGAFLRAGERIGHPSCEGGVSSGTHLHLARKYNGYWISADGDIPFLMDGWLSQGAGRAYDGYLVREGVTLEACACREPLNQVQR